MLNFIMLSSITKFLITFVYCIYVYMSMALYMHGGQRTTCRSCFSLSTMWDLGIELRSSGLAAVSLTNLTGPRYFCLFVFVLFFKSIAR